MTALTQGLGATLVVVGVGAWFAAGGPGTSPTAFIPALLGVLILVLGLLAGRESLHRHAIHAALVVALLGLIGSAPRAVGVAGDDAGVAAWASLVTAVLCLAYVGLGVRSFMSARQSA